MTRYYSFIAELLHESGYDVVFIDVVDDLVNKINETPEYKITEVGAEGTKTKTIKNYRAINSKHNMADAVETLSKAEIVTCAVGPTILKFIAKPISDAIIKRTADKVSSPHYTLEQVKYND